MSILLVPPSPLDNIVLYLPFSRYRAIAVFFQLYHRWLLAKTCLRIRLLVKYSIGSFIPNLDFYGVRVAGSARAQQRLAFSSK